MQKNVLSWIEQHIQVIMTQISMEKNSQKNLKLLDQFISLRKKYITSIDQYGERIRVMEEFINFVMKNYHHDIPKLQKICKDFLNQVQNHDP